LRISRSSVPRMSPTSMSAIVSAMQGWEGA
jgi:hypothetical protein